MSDVKFSLGLLDSLAADVLSYQTWRMPESSLWWTDLNHVTYHITLTRSFYLYSGDPEKGSCESDLLRP